MLKFLSMAAVLVALSGSPAASRDICDQIREQAERTATSTADKMRAFREYSECKRNQAARG